MRCFCAPASSCWKREVPRNHAGIVAGTKLGRNIHTVLFSECRLACITLTRAVPLHAVVHDVSGRRTHIAVDAVKLESLRTFPSGSHPYGTSDCRRKGRFARSRCSSAGCRPHGGKPSRMPFEIRTPEFWKSRCGAMTLMPFSWQLVYDAFHIEFVEIRIHHMIFEFCLIVGNQTGRDDHDRIAGKGRFPVPKTFLHQNLSCQFHGSLAPDHAPGNEFVHQFVINAPLSVNHYCSST